jgi:hypothetical protein
MTGQSIKLGVDTQGAEQDLADLARSLNQFLSEKGKAAGKQVNLLDVSRDLEALKELKKQFQELLAMSKQPGGIGHMVSLANGPKRPGVPSQINMAGVSSSAKEQAMIMERVLSRLLTHHLRSSTTPFNSNLTANDILGRPAARGDAPGAGPAPGPMPGPDGQSAQRRPGQPDSPSGASQAGRLLLGQALAGAGGTVGAGAGAGMAGAARGMAGMLPGGMAGGGLFGLGGYALFKGIGAASEGVDRAKAEAVEIDKFKRQLGDLGIDFDGLRDNVRDAAQGMGLSFEQTKKMAAVFGKAADYRGKDVVALAEETANAASIARATGIDPDDVASFFGEMRAVKATADVGDSRRMSLMIADAMKRTNGIINTDRLLESIATFAEHSKERSLSPVNVEGLGGLLSGMVGDGLRVGTASGLLSTLDASLRNPQSEMADAFVHEAIGGNRLGMGNSMRLKQAGMFASTQSVFGDKKSPFYDPSFQGADSTTTVDKFMSHLDKSFPGDNTQSKDAKEAALASFFGGNFAHARQFSKSYGRHGSAGLSTTSDVLRAMGIDPSELKMSGVAQVMEIANAQGSDELHKQRLGMLGRKDITESQRVALTKMEGEKAPEALRRALMDVAKTLDAEKTQGQALNDYARTMDNNLQKIGTGLIPAIEMTNALLGALVDQLAPDTPMGQERRRIEGEKKLDARAEALGQQIAQEPESMASQAKILSLSKSHLPGMFENDKAFGFAPGTTAAMASKESNFRPGLKKGAGRDAQGQAYETDAWGMFQMLPAARKDSAAGFKKRFGRDPDWDSAEDQQKLFGVYYGGLRSRAGGNDDLASQMYFAGGAVKGGEVVGATDKVSAAQRKAFAADVAGRRAMFGKQTPLSMGRAGALAVPDGNPQKVAEKSNVMGITVDGSVMAQIRLMDEQGQERGSVNAPARIHSGKPTAQGVAR